MGCCFATSIANLRSQQGVIINVEEEHVSVDVRLSFLDL